MEIINRSYICKLLHLSLLSRYTIKLCNTTFYQYICPMYVYQPNILQFSVLYITILSMFDSACW